MPEVETVAAESSPAPAAVVEKAPSFDIPRSGTAQYDEWRQNGTMPGDKKEEKPVVADSAPADTSKETTSANEPEPESGKPTQEKRRNLEVEARFKKLTDELKAVRTELEEARKPKTQAESSPAKQPPQQQPRNYQEWRQTFNATKWAEQFAAQNPDASYEDSSAAMAEYLWEAKDHFRSVEQQQRSQMEQTAAKVEDAKKRYGSFDEVAEPFVKAFLDDAAIPMPVKVMVSESDVWPDLIFTIASDPASAAEFTALAKTSPGKAARYIAKVEALIQEELGKRTPTGRNDKGQFVAAKPEPLTPAKRGPESAPEPPLEIGNRGSAAMDETARALSAAERGDPKAFRQWKEAEDRKELARLRGV